MKFTDFTLDEGLQKGLADAGYITCMPVQEQVLQNGLDGADLYVQSQTGTGKTAAYLVTILQQLATNPALAGKKALVMVPTRELAVQVEEEARIVGSGMQLKSASFYGGVGYDRQKELLQKGVDIIIGTPGRVIDLQESRTMDLSQVAFLVIDEADRMFDMGFYPDLRTLIRVLPKAEERQTMLFSATLNATVKNLAWEYTVEAKEITIEAENVTVDEIDQQLFHVSSDEKMKLLLGLLEKEKPESLIVFCNTKRMSEVVAKRLQINGYEADFIIGDLPQSKRLQVIDSFKSKSLRCLVATDVAARGIDVNDLAMVINYDLPNEAENYVHRIGRTARAGKTGKAYSFCSEQDVYNLPAIERYCESKIPSCVPGEEDMVEDKSAHVYIRTDRYDSDYDDGDSRSRGRDSRGRGRPAGGRSGDSHGRSSGGRPSGERRPSDSRPRSGEGRPAESRPSDSRPRSSEDRPSGNRPVDSRPRSGESRPRTSEIRNDYDRTAENRGRTGDYRPRDGQRRDGRRDGYRGQSAEQDLSKLSFEDRMAYYKTKYGSEEAAKTAESQRQAAAGRTPDAPAGKTPDGNEARKPEARRLGGDRQRRGDANRGYSPRSDANPINANRGDSNRGDGNRGDGNRGNANRDQERQTGTAPRGQSGRGRPQTGRTGQSSQSGRPAQDRNAQNRNTQGKPAQGRSAQGKPAQGTGTSRGGPARGTNRSQEAKQTPAAAAQKQPAGIGGFLKKIFGKK